MRRSKIRISIPTNPNFQFTPRLTRLRRQRQLFVKKRFETTHEKYQDNLKNLLSRILSLRVNRKEDVEDYWISKYEEYEKHYHNAGDNMEIEDYIKRINGIIESIHKIVDQLCWRDWDDTQEKADINLQIPILQSILLTPYQKRRQRILQRRCRRSRKNRMILLGQIPSKQVIISSKKKNKPKVIKISNSNIKRYEELVVGIYIIIKGLIERKKGVELYWVRKYENYNSYTYDKDDNLHIEDYIHDINKVVNNINSEIDTLGWIDWERSINSNTVNNKLVVKDI